MSGIIIENNGSQSVVFKFVNGSLNVTIRFGDISKESCDAIVNPTKTSMRPNGGLDTIIHQTMGQFFTSQVDAIRQQMGDNSCPTGQSRIFIARSDPGENIARFVINTVGPVYTVDEKERAAFLLQSCYHTSLVLANLYQLTSIAYPAISCGAFHFPAHEAAKVGIESIRQFSYHVKDVRFVLFDKQMYDVFVQEWTDYAQKVNREANVTDQIVTEQVVPKQVVTVQTDNGARRQPRPLTPVPPKASARYCVLCKEQHIPADRQFLCLPCSDLTRSDMFNKYLQRLRSAADQSFEELQRECRLLQPVLSSYPLVYTPAQKFDHSLHQRDHIAEYYLQSHCDRNFRNAMPMAILGDGNCFYNSFVKLGGVGTTTELSSVTPVELRARNVVELVLNENEYRTRYPDISGIIDEFRSYVTLEMVHDTNYTAVWDLFSITTVLNINVISVYPKVNGGEDLYYRSLSGAVFTPLVPRDTTDNNQRRREAAAAATQNDVKLLFSHCNRPAHHGINQGNWTSNHFVPLLHLR